MLQVYQLNLMCDKTYFDIGYKYKFTTSRFHVII